MMLGAPNSRGIAKHLVALALAACIGTPSCLAAASLGLSDMSHKSFTASDGAPQGINALAQASDGTLWIGANAGLFLFDGHVFSSFQPIPGDPDLPGGAVGSLLIARDGSIWSGYFHGGAARISRGHITLFSRIGSRSLIRVSSLSQATDGAIWALSGTDALIRFGDDQSWHLESTPLGPAGGPIQSIFIDTTDTLWLAQNGKIYRRPLNQSKYFPTDIQADSPTGLAEAPDHSFWLTDYLTASNSGRIQHIDKFSKVLSQLLTSQSSEATLLTRDGALVTAPYDKGLLRLAPEALADLDANRQGPATDEFRRSDGLSSDTINALILDMDGNLWVGGQRGLDRFTNARLIPFDSRLNTTQSRVCADGNGDIWVLGSDYLYRVSGNSKALIPNGYGYGIDCGRDGEVWFVNNLGIWNVRGDLASPVPRIPGALPMGIRQVVAGADHVLYATVISSPESRGIWKYADHAWVKQTPSSPIINLPTVEYLDSRGQLWGGFEDGHVGMLFANTDHYLPPINSGLGAVVTLLETPQGLLAAGINGIAVHRGGGMKMLSFADRTVASGAAEMVESSNGDLWFNSSRGIVRIPSGELNLALNRPNHPIQTEVIAGGDFGGPAWVGSERTGASARDSGGNLWFSSVSGIFHTDSRLSDANEHLPIVSIKSISADQVQVDSMGAISPGLRTLEIQYLGVNLTAPEKVTYRYRLDGLDSSWQAAGRRTIASYSQLPPGKYTFRVAASNDGKTWTVPISTGPITISPFFYQTAWFYLLCGLATLGLIWLVFTIRIRTISAAIRARADERADERIRIAREIHDTLLQGIQGLLLTFHVAAQKVSSDEESKRLLDNALSTADRIIVEGRNRVNSLRSDHLTDDELVDSLKNAGDDLKLDDRVEFHVNRIGGSAVLYSHIADEVFYIGREALTNAFRHSGASRIDLQLEYRQRKFVMTCSDNGRGFGPDKDKPGHWGLRGMAERAQKLGGELLTEGEAMRGAKVTLHLPAFRAYQSNSRIKTLLLWLTQLVQGPSKYA